MKINFFIFFFLLFAFIYFSTNATPQIYQMDGHEANWTAFHYVDEKKNTIDACFVISNDLVLGFKKDANNVGLFIWDVKAQLIPGNNKKVALTIGKEHFLFTMKAMDKNMLMNRLKNDDFKILLSKLSYANLVIVEFGQQPVNIVDLLGLPSMLSKFQRCVNDANFKSFK